MQTTEPMRVIHAARPVGDGTPDFWVLLNCGHITRAADKYHEISCSCCLGDNRKYTPAEFRAAVRVS